MQKLRNIQCVIVLLSVLLLCPKLFALDHVILMSWDGAGSKYVESNTDLKNFIALKKRSYFTFTSQSESPTITLPNHTSMVTGLSPSSHRVLWNKWEPEKGLIPLKTIFDLVHMANSKTKSSTLPGVHPNKSQKLTSGMFVGKEKLNHFYNKTVVDQHFLGKTAEETTQQLVKIITDKKLPTYSFVHFGEPDHAGHEFGWGSKEQKAALKVCDNMLGQIIAALKKAKLDSKTAIIMTADHGGIEKSHKVEVPEVKNIPFVLALPNLKSEVKIPTVVSNSRLASLAAQLLKLDVPKEWGWAAAPEY